MMHLVMQFYIESFNIVCFETLPSVPPSKCKLSDILPGFEVTLSGFYSVRLLH